MRKTTIQRVIGGWEKHVKRIYHSSSEVIESVNPFSILYIGQNSGTSRHRALALTRLGCDVFIIDPAAFLLHGRIGTAWIWKTGGLLLENFIRRKVLASIPLVKFDLVYVDGGELLGPSLICDLKNRFGTVINYNLDDPYGNRDGRRWRLYLQAVPFYDLIVVVRDCNVAEALARRARKVLRVHRAADEVAHSPRKIDDQDRQRWATEVAFIGTWMPERGPFMMRLIELGVPISIYGDRWHKAQEWCALRSFWRGPGLYNDDNYAIAVQCAKVNLGLLSKGNRDLVTQRSFEIPYLGGVLCAERSPEHAMLYRDDEEAVFWSSPEECAQRCTQLLNSAEYRDRIRIKGHNRCIQNCTTNQHVLAQILGRTVPSVPTSLRQQ
jgi:spore maturation protein CgeB